VLAHMRPFAAALPRFGPCLNLDRVRRRPSTAACTRRVGLGVGQLKAREHQPPI
jgi:hypothetical protein